LIVTYIHESQHITSDGIATLRSRLGESCPDVRRKALSLRRTLRVLGEHSSSTANTQNSNNSTAPSVVEIPCLPTTTPDEVTIYVEYDFHALGLNTTLDTTLLACINMWSERTGVAVDTVSMTFRAQVIHDTSKSLRALQIDAFSVIHARIRKQCQSRRNLSTVVTTQTKPTYRHTSSRGRPVLTPPWCTWLKVDNHQL
jgi:hypothetical protein